MPAPGILETLTDDQRDQLLTWMELFPAKTVVEMAAAPIPEGFGLKLHVTTLRRFHEGAQMKEMRHQLNVASSAVTPSEVATLQRAAGDALTKYALNMATLPNIKGENLGHITKWLVALREQELRAEKNKIARERLAHTVACEERKLQISQLKHGDTQPAPDPNKSEFLEMFRKSWERQEQQEQIETLVQI